MPVHHLLILGTVSICRWLVLDEEGERSFLDAAAQGDRAQASRDSRRYSIPQHWV